MDLHKSVRLPPERNGGQEKRGKRGAQQLLRRRGNRPPLSSMILCIARPPCQHQGIFSVSHLKYDGVHGNLLHQDVPNSTVEIKGFSLVRVDRNKLSGKNRGGSWGCVNSPVLFIWYTNECVWAKLPRITLWNSQMTLPFLGYYTKIKSLYYSEIE